jgi:hypothetical protein
MDVPQSPPPTPAEGNILSNVHLVRTENVYFAVEHPKDWTQAQVEKAVAARSIDIGTRVCFWAADSRTVVDEVVLGEFDPDDRYVSPLPLAAEDLGEASK